MFGIRPIVVQMIRPSKVICSSKPLLSKIYWSIALGCISAQSPGQRPTSKCLQGPWEK